MIPPPTHALPSWTPCLASVTAARMIDLTTPYQASMCLIKHVSMSKSLNKALGPLGAGHWQLATTIVTRIISETAPRIFSETRHEVGGKKCKKRSMAAFLRFRPVFSKTAHLYEKSHFWQFLGLSGKYVPRIFLNPI